MVLWIFHSLSQRLVAVAKKVMLKFLFLMTVLTCGYVSAWGHVKKKIWYSWAFLILKNHFSYFWKIEVAHLQFLWPFLQGQSLGSCPLVQFQHPWDQHSSYALFEHIVYPSYPVCLWNLAHKNLLHIPTERGSIWYENDPSPSLGYFEKIISTCSINSSSKNVWLGIVIK